MKLSQIRQGDRVEVVEIPKQCALYHMLQQFGIMEGSILYCRYCSPGSELVALECEGSVVALRLRQLTRILIRYC